MRPGTYIPTLDEVYQLIQEAAPGWGLSEQDDMDAFDEFLRRRGKEAA